MKLKVFKAQENLELAVLEATRYLKAIHKDGYEAGRIQAIILHGYDREYILKVWFELRENPTLRKIACKVGYSTEQDIISDLEKVAGDYVDMDIDVHESIIDGKEISGVVLY